MTAGLAEAAAAAFRRGFGGVLKIEPEEGPPIYVDGRADLCVISDAPLDVEPDCVWRAAKETLERAFEGGRGLESAYLSGRLKIAGDMSLMARLSMEGSR